MTGIAAWVWVGVVLFLGWLLRPRSSSSVATGETSEVLVPPSASHANPPAARDPKAVRKPRRRRKNPRRRRRATEDVGLMPLGRTIDRAALATGAGLGLVHRNAPVEYDDNDDWYLRSPDNEDDFLFSSSRATFEDDAPSASLWNSPFDLPSTNWTDCGPEINPANGVPMCGALDVLGNPYGFSDSIFDSGGLSDSISSPFDDPFDHGSGTGSDHGSMFDDLHGSSSNEDWHSTSHDD